MKQQASSVIGTCALCLARDVNLCYSDLIPKAISRWLRLSALPDQRNPNPVAVTKLRATTRNFRVAEYLLCPACEDRLNRNGESWVLRNAYRGGDRFPLRDFLLTVPPVAKLQLADLIQATTIPVIELEKLIYFGASIFWKAAACWWHLIDKKTTLELGPYAEQIRLYLLGEATFPEKASVVITVARENTTDDGNALLGAVFPYGGGRLPNGPRQHRFIIPEIAFWLHLGHMSSETASFSANKAGILCLAPSLKDVYLREMGPMIARAKSSSLVSF